MIYVFVIFLVVILLVVLIGYLIKRSKYAIDKRRHPDDIEGGPPTLRQVTDSVLHGGHHTRQPPPSSGTVLHTGQSLLEERRRNRVASQSSSRWNRMYDGDVEGDAELPTYSERAAPGTTLMTDRDGKDDDFPPPLSRSGSSRLGEDIELPQMPAAARTRL